MKNKRTRNTAQVGCLIYVNHSSSKLMTVIDRVGLHAAVLLWSAKRRVCRRGSLITILVGNMACLKDHARNTVNFPNTVTTELKALPADAHQ